jgi:hypothetical protein
MYVFFNHNTTAYEVYPVEAFSTMFPWQYHAGLFCLRTARLSYTPVSANACKMCKT